MMEDLPQVPVQENKPQRPGLLNILCILTFIGSGMNFISSLMVAMFYDQFTIIIENINNTFKLPGLDMILEGESTFFAVSALIYLGCLSGAMLMWKLKKTGFHIYTICQILLILCPMYFFHLRIPSFLDVVLSGIFVILYSSNLKYMS